MKRKNKATEAASVPAEEVLAKHMKDPEFRRAYYALEPEFVEIKRKIDARIKRRAKAKAKAREKAKRVVCPYCRHSYAKSYYVQHLRRAHGGYGQWLADGARHRNGPAKRRRKS